MVADKVPTFDTFMNPLIEALRELGGSGTIEEINGKTAEIAKLSDAQLEVIHDPLRGNTEFEYRLAWTRTYLKKYGILENSARGVWALTEKGRRIDNINPIDVKRFVREEDRKSKGTSVSEGLEKENLEPTWRDQLLATLLKMDPAAFERLTQRLLRESGFIQVQVTGQSGDGGIDGRGIMRLGGLLGFHVMFQCRRYQGSVSARHVRDFRGAMIGRADKGLLITTGNFTKDAIREATRDGAPAIDLIDGDQLVDMLKKLSLGVDSQIVEVEKVTIDENWFLTL